MSILHSELYDDVETRARADTRPWRPISATSPAGPYAISNSTSGDTDCFSVVELAGGQLAGEALLWAIDSHNRCAHLGLSLRPGYRGRGLAADVVRLLCRYGFAVRGMQRLQIETLADNIPMLRTAATAGFTREGTLRRAAWVNGGFLDEAVFGLLAHEWAVDGTP